MSKQSGKRRVDVLSARQRSLIDLYLVNCSPQALGTVGEMMIYWSLLELGVNVSLARLKGPDLRVVDSAGVLTRVEVKTARRGRDGRFQFGLWKKDKTDYRKSDVVVLVAVTPSGRFCLFMIPTNEIGERSTIKVAGDPFDYDGPFAKFRIPLHDLKSITSFSVS